MGWTTPNIGSSGVHMYKPLAYTCTPPMGNMEMNPLLDLYANDCYGSCHLDSTCQNGLQLEKTDE